MSQTATIGLKQKPEIRPVRSVARPACIGSAIDRVKNDAGKAETQNKWVGNCGCTCLCPGR